MIDLRQDFFDIMEGIAKSDKDVIIITGDLGYSKYEGYALMYPNQFLNCGCMEDGMVGIAAGMALAGKRVYVYSNSVFLLCRAYEQIRDDICYNKLDVKLVGTGAAGFLGFSHNWKGWECEFTLLCNLPKIKIFEPKDKKELKKVLESKGCAFIRI